MADAAPKKRSTFRKYTYRGIDLENLVVMPMPELIEKVHARARRRFKHGLPRKYWSLLKRLRDAKKACNTAEGEKPACIKTGCHSPCGYQRREGNCIYKRGRTARC